MQILKLSKSDMPYNPYAEVDSRPVFSSFSDAARFGMGAIVGVWVMKLIVCLSLLAGIGLVFFVILPLLWRVCGG